MAKQKPGNYTGSQNHKYKKSFDDVAREVMSKGGSKTMIAAEIGVCRKSVGTWMHTKPSFKQAVNEGMALGSRHYHKLITQCATGVDDGTYNFNALKFLAQIIHKDDFRDPTKQIEQKVETNLVPTISVSFGEEV